jgi:hypothetical protein
MALTVAVVKRTGITPTGRTVVADVTFDSGYPAGGEPFTAAEFGLNKIDHMESGAALASSTTGLLCFPNLATSKLMLFGMAAAAGVGTALTETNTANQSATVVRLLAYELPNI